jgi:DNA-binding MarR family transcriptional regulator
VTASPGTITKEPATDAALASSLRISIARLARRMRAQLADASYTTSQLAVLASLERHGPMTPTSLAEHEKVQPPSMTRVVAALEQGGLVTRTAHPHDRRQAVVAITPAGQELLQADRRQREAWLSRRLAELSQEDRQRLRAAAGVLDHLSQS